MPELRASACLVDLFDQLAALAILKIRHGDVGSLARQQQAGRASDSDAATGYNRGFSFGSFHGFNDLLML